MATIFPPNPSINDEFQGYRWSGTSWNIIGVDLTADYPEIVDGYISDAVIPLTIARVDDLNPSLLSSSSDIIKAALFFGGSN